MIALLHGAGVEYIWMPDSLKERRKGGENSFSQILKTKRRWNYKQGWLDLIFEWR